MSLAVSHLLGVTSTVLNGQPFLKRRVTYESRLVRPCLPWMIRVARERPRPNETPPFGYTHPFGRGTSGGAGGADNSRHTANVLPQWTCRACR